MCIYILSSEVLLEKYGYLAERFVRAFVEHSVALFGKHFCVYNVHSIIHVPTECREHGALEKFSAYPFENLLQVLVNIVKSSNRPLQQLINRLAEREKYLVENKSEMEGDFVLAQEVNADCEFGGREFLLIKLKRGFCLGVNRRDRCFTTKDGSTMVLTNIVQSREKVVLYANKFGLRENFYTYPINSSIPVSYTHLTLPTNREV